jgi:hypothetical protein
MAWPCRRPAIAIGLRRRLCVPSYCAYVRQGSSNVALQRLGGGVLLCHVVFGVSKDMFA